MVDGLFPTGVFWVATAIVYLLTHGLRVKRGSSTID